MIEKIELNIVDICNRSCSFCPRGIDYPNTSNRLTIKDSLILKQRLKDYKNTITVSGFGEPLLHKEFVDVLSNVLPMSAKRILITNGDYLTPEKYNEIKHLFTHIKISLYDEDTSEHFKSFIDNVSFNHYYKGPSNEVNRNDIYTNDGNGIQGVCHIPFYKLFVDYDIKTYLCSNDWSKSVQTGDLRKDNLDTIWNSKEYYKYRKDLYNGNRIMFPCSNCDVCGTIEGKESFESFKEMI